VPQSGLDQEIQKLTENWNNATSENDKKEVLFERAGLYELAGLLDEALQDYLYIQSEYNERDPKLMLQIYQLKYETGQWNYLSELSRNMLLQKGYDKIPFIVEEARLLMSLGEWNETENLLRQYRDFAIGSPELLYINWFFYEHTSNQSLADYWAEQMESRFPDSLEQKMILGMVKQSDSPSILLLNKQVPNELYYYQAGAYKNQESARELQDLLVGRGFQCSIRQSDSWYKVLVASTSSQDSELLDLLEQMGIKAFKIEY